MFVELQFIDQDLGTVLRRYDLTNRLDTPFTELISYHELLGCFDEVKISEGIYRQVLMRLRFTWPNGYIGSFIKGPAFNLEAKRAPKTVTARRCIINELISNYRTLPASRHVGYAIEEDKPLWDMGKFTLTVDDWCDAVKYYRDAHRQPDEALIPEIQNDLLDTKYTI